ncbi:MAG: hypothetical protein IKA74_00480 [Clostridia bacterium]|nr:hypothetical protein [Clostridia bacterium]
MRSRLCWKAAIGIGVFSFGLGVLISFFLPEAVLVVMEALVLIALGIICYAQR